MKDDLVRCKIGPINVLKMYKALQCLSKLATDANKSRAKLTTTPDWQTNTTPVGGIQDFTILRRVELNLDLTTEDVLIWIMKMNKVIISWRMNDF